MKRIHDIYRPMEERKSDWNEVERSLTDDELKEQTSRCMNCGQPFCHAYGCPLGNLVPDQNRAVAQGDWKRAYDLLSQNSDFPEFTSRICPALCEASCVHQLDEESVMVRQSEKRIIETAFNYGWVVPRPPTQENGKKVAIIGAGPAGLSAAVTLRRRGWAVTVYERRANIGGLLRYGIPNFKLNKTIIDRRLRLLAEEGIEFKYGEDVQLDAIASQFSEQYDAVVIATGTPTARDLKAPGRELKGVHFALELLSQQNRVLAGMEFTKDERITAKGKNVLVIGGGDTGSDCIGTAHRQGARSVTQIEIMPRPVEGPDDPQNPWPNWPRTLKTTSSHEEGCVRRWNINTLEFLGENGKLTGVRVQAIDWQPNPNGGRPLMVEKGEPEVIKAELVLLAMGFLKPEHPQYPANVFVCGDAANGASLVVRAMASGKKTAIDVDKFLKK